MSTSAALPGHCASKISVIDPEISVVVATYQRPDRLAGLIAALEAQDTTLAFEVVIVDDGSTDEAWARLVRLVEASSTAVQAIRQRPNQGPAVARNLGWRTARASRIAFTDDDCLPTPGWLEALHNRLSQADLVQGRTLPNPDHADRWGPFSRSVTAIEEDFYATCNVGYRRAVLEKVGGFEELFGRYAGEDTDLACRARSAGFRGMFETAALVHHEVRPSDYRDYLRDKRRWEGIGLVVARHPELRPLLPMRWFWRPAHPPALAAAAGCALVAATMGASGKRRLAAAVSAVALGAPYVRYRTKVDPLPGIGPRRRLGLLPAALLADLIEVAVMVRASARYRTLVL
jgi:GT2 family glycosyltransferase